MLQVETSSTQSLKTVVSGTITRWNVKPGQAIENGQIVLYIDERPIIAQIGGIPFYRSLGLGDSGKDVEALHELLCAKNCPAGLKKTRSTFDGYTQKILEQWKTELGLSPISRFNPQDTLYFAPGAQIITKITAFTGSQVSPGEQLAELSASVSAASLVKNTEEARLELPAIPIKLVAGKLSLELQNQQELNEKTVELVSFLAKGVAQGHIAISPSRDPRYILYTGIDVQALTAQDLGIVPSLSVLLGADGTSCVFMKEKDQVKVKILKTVEAVPGKLSQIGIDPQLVGKTVVAYPGDLDVKLRSQCESK